MRIVSYNILDGGVGRADPLAEVIEAQRPDIVALVEADDPDVVERIARRLGMDVVRAEGKKHAIALLSRWTIVESINHALLRPAISKCFLEVRLALTPALSRSTGRGGEESGGGELIIGVVHLHAHAAEADEQKREGEIADILKVMAGYRTARMPHLLLGDFNSNSPLQEIDPAKLKPSSAGEFAGNGGKLPRRVMQRLFDEGYIDCLGLARPQEARKGATLSTLNPGQRVDYILAHGIETARIKDAWIETDRLAKYASDHYPVGAEVR